MHRFVCWLFLVVIAFTFHSLPTPMNGNGHVVALSINLKCMEDCEKEYQECIKGNEGDDAFMYHCQRKRSLCSMYCSLPDN